MVKDLFSGENKILATKEKHLELVISQLDKKGIDTPKELLDFRDFLHM